MVYHLQGKKELADISGGGVTDAKVWHCPFINTQIWTSKWSISDVLDMRMKSGWLLVSYSIAEFIHAELIVFMETPQRKKKSVLVGG